MLWLDPPSTYTHNDSLNNKLLIICSYRNTPQKYHAVLLSVISLYSYFASYQGNSSMIAYLAEAKYMTV